MVIPVKDGERYLEELLDALAREGVEEIARDRLRLARPLAARSPAPPGVELLEIEPGEFGHGRTRNLGAERTSGELICFLTQDATPCPGWLAAYREAFALDEQRRRRLRTAPATARHQPDDRPRADASSSPASSAGDGSARRPVIQSRAAAPRSSRTSTPATRAPAGRRSAFARSPTPRTRPSAPTCWRPAGSRSTTPAPPSCTRTTTARWSSCAATSTSTAACTRAPATSSRSRLLAAARQVRAARSPAIAAGWPSGVSAAPEQARWTARAAVHHGGRRVFSALGSRAERAARAAARAGSRSRAATERQASRQRQRMPPRRARTADVAGGSDAPDRRADVSPVPAGRAHRPDAAPRRLRRGRARLARRARRRCSTRCPAWPSASACAWRW